MKKSTALKEIKGLKEDLEKILEKSSEILTKSVKHKHMFNDIKYVIDNTQWSLDHMLELEREIEGKDDEEKKEAFMIYGMPEVAGEEKVEYDFEWDDEEEDKDDKKDKEDD